MPISIAIDIEGDLTAPKAATEAAFRAVKKYPDLVLRLVGREETFRSYLPKIIPEQIIIQYANSKIMPEDEPKNVLRKGNSMAAALMCISEGKANAVISSGNTGALILGAIRYTRLAKGIRRPPLSAQIPNERGSALLLDVGAIEDPKPEELAKFAQMARAYLIAAGLNPNPTVGVLSIGKEKGKGNELTRKVCAIFQGKNWFVGNIEPEGLFAGESDIVIADGFVGNIFIKAVEGFVHFMKRLIKSRFGKSSVSRIIATLALALATPGLILALPLLLVLKRMYRQVDPNKFNGAIILGVLGLVFKAHGSSSAEGFLNTIETAYRVVSSGINIPAAIEHDLAQ